jgi:hypothetical protein
VSGPRASLSSAGPKMADRSSAMLSCGRSAKTLAERLTTCGVARLAPLIGTISPPGVRVGTPTPWAQMSTLP